MRRGGSAKLAAPEIAAGRRRNNRNAVLLGHMTPTPRGSGRRRDPAARSLSGIKSPADSLQVRY